MQSASSEILALDVGERRIGVASANPAARMATPLTTLTHEADIFEQIAALLADHSAMALVIGLPRGLDGQETAQTQRVRDFAAQLAAHVAVPLHWQDEALTSRKAEDELQSRGKPFSKGDIDALAATYILEDFLHDNPDPTRWRVSDSGEF